MAERELVLVCAHKHCRWRPPNDLQMNLVEAHFDMEDGHDPEDIHLEMVAWCHRCGVEMKYDHTRTLWSGDRLHCYTCPSCRRAFEVKQEPEASDG